MGEPLSPESPTVTTSRDGDASEMVSDGVLSVALTTRFTSPSR